MTQSRVPLGDLTSDQLDQLYNDLDRCDEVQGEMNEQAIDHARRIAQLEGLLRIAHDTSNTSETERARAVERANRAEGERGDLLVKLAAVREDRDRWRDQARTEQADRRIAEEESRRARQAESEQRARADRAEAAIERVRAYAADLDRAGWTQAAIARRIRAALDEQQEQTAAAEREPVCSCPWGGLKTRRCPVHEPTI